MAAPEPKELTAQDIGDYLSARDDFDLELFAHRTLRGRGWIVQHGGAYIDPLLGKRRQYDIRASKRFEGMCDVNLAVECKSLSKELPLVVSRMPRARHESVHDVMKVTHSVGDGRQVHIHPSDADRLCLYGPTQMVGKSLTRIGWDQSGKKLTASDTELYDRWSQAIASAGELVSIVAQKSTHNSKSYGFVMPVLLVNDDSLWVVDYDEDGARKEAQLVDEAHYFADAKHEFPNLFGATGFYRTTHLHIYTRTGFDNMLKNYGNPSGTMWERTFSTAFRAG